MYIISLIYIGGDISYTYQPSIRMWSPEQLMSTCEVAKGENEGVLIENEFVSSSQTSYCTLQWPTVEEMKQSLTIDIVSCGYNIDI